MRPSAGVIAISLALVGFGLVAQEERGNRAYRAGDHREAVERYREALRAGEDDPRVRYNLGTALLQVGEWEEARAQLSEALQGRDPDLRADAFYNLGNARARSVGEGSDDMERLRGAIEAYRRALLLQPGQEDARWNLELALQRLEQLERERTSFPGQEAQPLEEPEEQGGQEPLDPGREGTEQSPPRPTDQAEPPQSRDVDATPLNPSLAEQILRAVEEQERGLQRDRLRQQNPARRSGPDW